MCPGITRSVFSRLHMCTDRRARHEGSGFVTVTKRPRGSGGVIASAAMTLTMHVAAAVGCPTTTSALRSRGGHRSLIGTQRHWKGIGPGIGTEAVTGTVSATAVGGTRNVSECL